mgnify:CR=1 FL=1
MVDEGNADGNFHLRDSLYDEDWNEIILYEERGTEDENEAIYTAYTNNEERQLTMSEYDEEISNLYDNCTMTEAVAEMSGDPETTQIDKQGILDFLQSLSSTKDSGTEAETQNGTVTGYPEYDEIIRQYYQGMISKWSMNEFSEKNLCYLAGLEMSGADNLGYCLMDINGDGIDELVIGNAGDNPYTGMFFDMYTIVEGQRVLVASSGERDRYYVCEDYTIANEASGGAMSSSFKYYDFVSGQLQIKENVFLDGFDHPENPWFYTTTEDCTDYSIPISEEEGQNTRGKYSHMNIPYVSLSEIGSQTVAETTQPETSSYRQQAEESVKTAEQKASSALTGSEQYEIWDNCLNEIWSYLQEALSSEDMDTLTQEELDWITGKENIINSAENPSAEETLIKVAEITKERVYELLDRLS